LRQDLAALLPANRDTALRQGRQISQDSEFQRSNNLTPRSPS